MAVKMEGMMVLRWVEMRDTGLVVDWVASSAVHLGIQLVVETVDCSASSPVAPTVDFEDAQMVGLTAESTVAVKGDLWD